MNRQNAVNCSLRFPFLKNIAWCDTEVDGDRERGRQR